MKRMCLLVGSVALCLSGCQDMFSIAVVNGCGIDLEMIEASVVEPNKELTYKDVPEDGAAQVTFDAETWETVHFFVRAKGDPDPGKLVEVDRGDARQGVGEFDYVFDVKDEMCPG